MPKNLAVKITRTEYKDINIASSNSSSGFKKEDPIYMLFIRNKQIF